MRCTEIVNILEIARLSELGLTQREIADSVKCGKSTVGDVQKRCRDAGLAYAVASDMTSSELNMLLYPAKVPDREDKYPDWEALHKWLKGGKRRNLQYAWEEYRLREPGGLGYSQYCKKYKAWKEGTGKTVTMVQNHEPGDKAFIDWAGDTLDCVVDPDTGEVHTAHFFVAVLGYSCYPFAEAFPDERMESWITANVHALEWFGGSPRVIVPDNATTAITKPHNYDPKFNPTYLAFAQHEYTAAVFTRLAAVFTCAEFIIRTDFTFAARIAFADDAVKTAAVGRVVATRVLRLIICVQRVMIQYDRRKFLDAFRFVRVFAGNLKYCAAC